MARNWRLVWGRHVRSNGPESDRERPVAIAPRHRSLSVLQSAHRERAPFDPVLQGRECVKLGETRTSATVMHSGNQE